MTDCPLERNAKGFWQCPDCNWIYKRKTDKPPRRNCPKSPALNSPEHRAKIHDKMLTELQSFVDSGNCDLATVTMQLDLCLAPCKRFDGRTCTLRGSDCKKWQRWKEFLAFTARTCPYFAA